MYLSKAIEQFIEWSRFGNGNPLSQETLYTYRKNAKVILLEIGDLKVKKIKKEHVTKIKEAMYKRGCSDAYVEKVLVFLRLVFKYLSKERGMTVMSYKSMDIPKRRWKFVEYLTEERANFVCASIPRDTLMGQRFYLLVLILLDTGMRITEVLNLRVDQIDLKEGMAIVKGKGSRLGPVFFHPWCLKEIRSYLIIRNIDSPYLFINHGKGKGKQWAYKGAEKCFLEISKKVGFRVTAHTLRRTAATLMHHKGADIWHVKDFLRHRLINTTQYYVGINYALIKKTHQKYGFKPRGLTKA